MPKYNEQIASVYTRANTIVINNPLPETGRNPNIRYNEERVIVENGVEISAGLTDTFCAEKFTPENSTEEFNLVDPETGSTIGTANYEDVMIHLYSLYFHLAQKRDAALLDAPPPEQEVQPEVFPIDGG